jgi:hypothetical protein
MPHKYMPDICLAYASQIKYCLQLNHCNCQWDAYFGLQEFLIISTARGGPTGHQSDRVRPDG